MPARLTKISIVLFALASCSSASFAQETKVVEKTVSVAASATAQIGVFGRVTPECDNGKVKVRLAEPAENGTVTARPARLKQGVVKNCPALTPDVAAVFYQPKAGFSGQDKAAIEVETDDGKVERHEFTINVQ